VGMMGAVTLPQRLPAKGFSLEGLEHNNINTNIAGTETLPGTSLRASWAHGGII